MEYSNAYGQLTDKKQKLFDRIKNKRNRFRFSSQKSVMSGAFNNVEMKVGSFWIPLFGYEIYLRGEELPFKVMP